MAQTRPASEPVQAPRPPAAPLAAAADVAIVPCPGDLAAWDAFVSAHPNAAAGHLAATRTLSVTLDGVRDRSLVARTEGGALAGVFPLFETEERALRVLRVRSLVSGCLLPAGPLVAPGMKAKDRDRLVARFHEKALALANSLGADRLVVGLPAVTGGRPATEADPVSPLLEHGYRDAPRAGLLLDLAPTEEALFAGLESTCRNKIRRCRKEEVGAALLDGASAADRAAWLSCHAYSLTYDAPNRFPRAAFEVVWDEFVAKGRAFAVAARDGDELLAVVVMSLFAGSAYYWFTFARPGNPPGVNNLALWTCVAAARERGARFVELGSLEWGAGKSAAISRFKRSFGGRPAYAWAGVRDLRPGRRAALELADAAVGAVRRLVPARSAPAAAPAEPPEAPA